MTIDIRPVAGQVYDEEFGWIPTAADYQPVDTQYALDGTVIDEPIIEGTAAEPEPHQCGGLDGLDQYDLDLCRALSEHIWADRLVGWWAEATRNEAVTRQIFDEEWFKRAARLGLT